MHRILTVISKHPTVSTEDFRRFVRDVYGPVYQAMPQVRSYTQHFLTPIPSDTDQHTDSVPDAVVMIAFDSPEAMRHALDTHAYRTAVEQRQNYMATIRASVLDATITLA